MAEGVLNCPIVLKKKTVSTTGDSNGFVDTGLKSDSNVVVGVSSLTVNNQSIVAFFPNILECGGSLGEWIAIQFVSWNGTVYAKNKSVQCEIIYITY